MASKDPGRLPSSGVFYGLLFLLSLFTQSSRAADSATPFNTSDQNPLFAIYGVPGTVSGRNLGAGRSELQLSLNLSNTIIREVNSNESLLVDVESYRLNLVYGYGLNARWMLRFQLPLIHHGPGFMDDWIDNYHNLLGLPEDIRPFYPNDQIHLTYDYNGQRLLDIQERSSGVGDLALQLAYQAYAEPDFYLNYWISLKLDTGDSTRLTGSGSNDLALWLALDNRMARDSWLFLNLGMVFMEDSEVLSTRHQNLSYFASTGMQFHPWQPLQLKFQLEAHGSAYDTATDFLGSAILLTFGGSILLDPQSALDIAIQEDLQTGASPDVNFNINWRRQF